MAKPTQPKEIKPKAEVEAEHKKGSGFEIDNKKLLIVNSIITVIICIVFVGSNYLIINSSMKKIAASTASTDATNEEGAAGEEGESEEVEHGLILDLGEFILNLSDPKERRYLKVNVAIELTKKDTDPVVEEAAAGGEGHGEGAADPMEAVKAEMDQYRPAVRDAIISILSSKTADELSSTTGKELSKEQIKEAVDSIFSSQREVIRVSFGSFIIQ